MKLLVTRPIADAERTANALRKLRHTVVVAPLMEIRLLQPPLPDALVPATLVTSANAIAAVAERREVSFLIDRPLLAVGERTAEAAHVAGFSNILSAAGDARDLLELVTAHLEPDQGQIVYLSGRDVSVDLAVALEASGFDVRRIVVYEAAAAKSLPERARQAIAAGEIDGVLLYSVRSARILLGLARQAGLLPRLAQLTAFCLSEAVAMPWCAAGLSRFEVATRPEEAALFETLR